MPMDACSQTDFTMKGGAKDGPARSAALADIHGGVSMSPAASILLARSLWEVKRIASVGAPVYTIPRLSSRLGAR